MADVARSSTLGRGGQHGDQLAAERLMPSLTDNAHLPVSPALLCDYFFCPPREDRFE